MSTSLLSLFYVTGEFQRFLHRGRAEIFQFKVIVLQRTAKKCAKNYHARAQSSYCSLNISFREVLVAIVVFVSSQMQCNLPLMYKTLKKNSKNKEKFHDVT